MHNVLFIGGPLDGRREKVDRLMPYWECPVLPKPNYTKLLEKDAPMYQPMEIVRYRLGNMLDKHIYFIEHIEFYQAVDLMIERYPLPLPTHAKH